MSLGVQGLIWDAGGVGEERGNNRKRRGSRAGRKGKCCSLRRARKCPLGVAPFLLLSSQEANAQIFSDV